MKLTKEQFLNEVRNNTTFIFTGHNIKWFSVIAIESFIDCCNFDRNRVWYFDDFSNDESKEELEKRNVKVITWTRKEFEEFAKSPFRDDLCIRVDQILKCAYRQVKTKYVCFLDGDTFYKGDFVERYFGYMYDHIPEEQEECFLLGGIRNRSLDFGGKPIPSIFMRNIEQLYLWFDCKIATKNKLLENSIDKMRKYYNIHREDFINYYDTGTLLYLATTQANVPYYGAMAGYLDSLVDDIMYHLTWLSSSRRNDLRYGKSWEETKESMLNKVAKEYKAMCEKYNVSYDELEKSFISTFKASDIC